MKEDIRISAVCSAQGCKLRATAAIKVGDIWLSRCQKHTVDAMDIEFTKARKHKIEVAK